MILKPYKPDSSSDNWTHAGPIMQLMASRLADYKMTSLSMRLIPSTNLTATNEQVVAQTWSISGTKNSRAESFTYQQNSCSLAYYNYRLMYVRMLGQYWLNNLSSPGPVSMVHGSSAIRAACFSTVLLHKHVDLKAGPHSLVFSRICVRSGRFRAALVSHGSRKSL